MFNHDLEITISGTQKSCDQLLESRERRSSGRRQGAVQFPLCILLIVFAVIIVFLLCYRKHLNKIADIPSYSARDFIHDRNLFYSDLYYSRVRNIVLGFSGNKSVNDFDQDVKWVDSMKLCSGLNRRSYTEQKRSVGRIPEALHNDVTTGGAWKPKDCIPRHRVAIVIPYRDRQYHLKSLLNTLVPILKSQNIHFQIYVSEQVLRPIQQLRSCRDVAPESVGLLPNLKYGNGTFNKGALMNAAFKQALRDHDWHCFVFHDVDLIPETTTNMYTCPHHPRHMSVAIDEMGYRLPYDYLVGGVFVLRTEHFRQLNGYSNSYWGWGAEDDDMSVRIKEMGFRIDRPPYNVARYKMLKHTKREAAEFRQRYIPLSKTKYRFHVDGLNSLNYTLISKSAQPLFTHLLIDVGTPPA